jgi:methyl-galactoside transport system substrate-binding protein
MAAKLLNGETVENVNMVDYIKITKENAQDTLDKLKK